MFPSPPSASKSPLALSTGCLWYTKDPLNSESTVVELFAITKDTSVPDTVVHFGIVTSVEADKILNALTPFKSAANPDTDLVIT